MGRGPGRGGGGLRRRRREELALERGGRKLGRGGALDLREGSSSEVMVIEGDWDSVCHPG